MTIAVDLGRKATKQTKLHECSCNFEFIKQLKETKFEACREFYHFFARSLINSMIYRCTNIRFYLSYDIRITLNTFGEKAHYVCNCVNHHYITLLNM